MLTRIRRKNITNSQSAFCTQSAVYIFYQVCILHRSVVYILNWPDCIAVSVRSSLKSRPNWGWSSKNNFSGTILATMIDVWAVCWRAPEKTQNDRVMITLYQLKTSGLPTWLPLMFLSAQSPFFWDNLLEELGNQAQLSSQAYLICAQAFPCLRDLSCH